MMSYSRVLVATAALAPLLACAQSDSKVKSDDLQRTVASLRAQNAAYLRHIEELENQVFILSDRAESSEVNAQRVAAPELPRVQLQPGLVAQPLAQPAGPAVTPVASLEPSYGSDAGDGAQVEYVGEAASSASQRPVLRLVGDNGGITVREEASAPRAEPRRVAITGEHADARAVRKVPKPDTASDVRSGPAAATMYRMALNQLNSGQHADAAAGFREFLDRFHDHEFADNAQYWLGECYYDLKDYPSAVREFRRVVETYPTGNKVPDALLKAGYAYQAMGELDASRKTLEELRRTYPEHQAAQLATDRLAATQPGPTSQGKADK